MDEQIASKCPRQEMSMILHNNEVEGRATGHEANNYVQ